jgi:CubicO group peptidase (beta-lactamase class C family)
MATIDGEVAAGYEPVREAFQANFEQRGEVGAAFALYKDGTKVVDLWGGVADVDTGRAWDEDTLQLVFSTTKGATAACAMLLVERGLLDLDAPVVEYWPEFKAEGKQDIPVRWLLSHRAGLPAVDAELSAEQLFAWDPIVEALAAQAPYWEPGSKHGYHAVTYGYLVGEVIRRISGRSVGAFFADEIAGPLGDEFFIGLPAQHEPRVTKHIEQKFEIPADQRDAMKDMDLNAFPPEVRDLIAAFLDPNSLSMRALNLVSPALDFNDPALHAAEIPAANGICTARSLARFYAGLIGEVDGVRILKPETVDVARTEQSSGPDEILKKITRFGLGFMLDGPDVPYFGDGSFGHDGAGGSMGFADPESGIAFGYVMNKMNGNINADPRPQALVEAVRTCL